MLVACDRCKRHISVREEVCPFCRQPGALSMLGAAALSAGVLLAGCDAAKDTQPSHEGSAVVAKRTYATLRGVVKDRSGMVLANAQVQLNAISEDSNRQYLRSVPTDANGAYAIDLVEPGTYSVFANYSENGAMLRGFIQQQLALAAGEDRTLDITIVRQQDVAQPYGAPPARRRTV
jgi:hypothetical protein